MPLYNESPLVQEVENDGVDNVERKLVADAALSSVDVLDGIIQSFEGPRRKHKKATARKMLPKNVCSRIGLPVLAVLTFGLLVAAVVSLAIAQARECVSST